MGRLDNPATSIGDGRKAVTAAGTAEKLSSTSVRVQSLAVTAETDNTGFIAVGGSNVDAAEGSQRGVILSSGQSTALDIDDLAKVWIDSTVSGDGVSFAYSFSGSARG